MGEISTHFEEEEEDDYEEDDEDDEDEENEEEESDFFSGKVSKPINNNLIVCDVK